MLLQLLHQVRAGLGLLRQLLGILYDQALEFIVGLARLVIGEVVELLLGKSNPLTKGPVMSLSIAATVDLSCLDIGQLAQLGV